MPQITNQQLFELITDIENHQAASPAFALFHAQKIHNLYAHNAIRIKAMKERLAELIMKYSKKDDKTGNPVYFQQNGMLQMEFENELDKKQYMTEYHEFASRTISINI